MKMLMLLPLMGLMIGQAAFAAKNNDCTLAVFKTYVPNMPAFGKQRELCDDTKLPAEHAGKISPAMVSFYNKGFQPDYYDQCTDGRQSPHAFRLVTQVGNCSPGFGEYNCQVKAEIFNRKGQVVYTKIATTKFNPQVFVNINAALDEVPTCAELK